MSTYRVSISFLALLHVACLSADDDAPATLDLEDDKSDSVTPAGDPLAMKHAVQLQDFAGEPYLLVMLQSGGIKANLDEDYTSTYKVATWSSVRAAVQSFDTKIVRKLARAFDTSTGLHDLTVALRDEPFTPGTMTGIVWDTDNRPSDVYTVAQVLAMASGAGTLVTIDDANYFYNYGYRSGAEADDVKSGRSFGASPGHRANDASDTFYLGELDRYLTSDTNATSLFTTLLDILTRIRLDGYAELSTLGQAVATDFLAIYTAESDRHIMAELQAHPWENDLAEATFVSTWVTATDMIMKDRRIVAGSPKDWWALSAFSNRSGIGITRWDRRLLQRLITSYERTHHPELVAAIESITGPRTDMFRAVMEYLNNPRFFTDHDALRTIPGEELTRAFVAFLVQVRRDAPDMLATAEFAPYLL